MKKVKNAIKNKKKFDKHKKEPGLDSRFFYFLDFFMISLSSIVYSKVLVSSSVSIQSNLSCNFLYYLTEKFIYKIIFYSTS